MSFHFDVGQRVICIDVSPNKAGGLRPTYWGTNFPVVGGIYTIRRIFCARRYGHDDVGVLLNEVRNPVRRYFTRTGRNVRCEPFFLSYRFRPVKPTSIEVFRRLLEPESVREVKERVDA